MLPASLMVRLRKAWHFESLTGDETTIGEVAVRALNAGLPALPAFAIAGGPVKPAGKAAGKAAHKPSEPTKPKRKYTRRAEQLEQLRREQRGSRDDELARLIGEQADEMASDASDEMEATPRGDDFLHASGNRIEPLETNTHSDESEYPDSMLSVAS